jgi:hypothetical protein
VKSGKTRVTRKKKPREKCSEHKKNNVPVPETKLNWQRSETRMETERDRNGIFGTISDQPQALIQQHKGRE